MARLNASWFAFDGAVKPLILRTNCTDAARTSSSVAGGSKLKSGRMFLHITLILRACGLRATGLRTLSPGLRNRFEAEFGCFLLGILLRAADAFGNLLVADEHFDVKHLAMVGADFARHPVRGQRSAARLQALLQARLVIAAEILRLLRVLD